MYIIHIIYIIYIKYKCIYNNICNIINVPEKCMRYRGILPDILGSMQMHIRIA